MKLKALAATLLVIAASFVCFVPSENDDAASLDKVWIDGGNTVTIGSNGGTITLMYNASVNVNNCVISIYDSSDLKNPVVLPQTVDFQVGENRSVEIYVNYEDGSSSNQMTMTFSDNAYKSINFTLKFSKSIWDNWATYVVIIVVAILIIALVAFKSRMGAAKPKNQMTFEQLEAMEKAKKAAPAEEKKQTGTSTERQKYLASKKKK